MPALQSSHLAACEWDAETSELEITFTDGETWSYAGVPGTVYEALLRAGSPGRYFGQFIKGIYPAQQV